MDSPTNQPSLSPLSFFQFFFFPLFFFFFVFPSFFFSFFLLFLPFLPLTRILYPFLTLTFSTHTSVLNPTEVLRNNSCKNCPVIPRLKGLKDSQKKNREDLSLLPCLHEFSIPPLLLPPPTLFYSFFFFFFFFSPGSYLLPIFLPPCFKMSPPCFKHSFKECFKHQVGVWGHNVPLYIYIFFTLFFFFSSFFFVIFFLYIFLFLLKFFLFVIFFLSSK